MIDFTEIPYQEDTWELFARDFLEEVGFFIESPPDRGADGGKDMLITEVVKGKLHSYRFRWLVSCKHYATSGKAVNENDHEKSILERLKSFKADGFIGFYSTLPSAGLNTRLSQLRQEKEIKDYRVFDHKLIEKHLLQKGFSRLLMRYFPKSHKEIAPIYKILDEYIPLECCVCGKDLLESMFTESYKGLVAYLERYDKSDEKYHVEEIYFACKGECDEKKRTQLFEKYQTVAGWKDLSDLIIPADFIKYIITTMNQLHSGRYIYSEQARKKEKELFIALSQKVLREMTDKERERFRDIVFYSL